MNPMLALSLGQMALGGINSLRARGQANEYESKMEKMARTSPLQTQSPEIANYYGESLNRYRQNPFTTPYYLEMMKQAERQGVNQISQAQSRGAAIGLIPKINQSIMDAKNRGIVGSLANKNTEFNQLGSATQMRKNERDQLFDINQMTPYNRVLQLQQLKTQAANDRYNAGLSMTAQGFGNLAQLGIADKMYNSTLKNQDVPVTQADSNLAAIQSFDAARADLPGLSGFGSLGVPRTNALKPRQPFLGRTAQPSYFEKPIPYNYGRPALRDYTNMTLPY